MLMRLRRLSVWFLFSAYRKMRLFQLLALRERVCKLGSNGGGSANLGEHGGRDEARNGVDAMANAAHALDDLAAAAAGDVQRLVYNNSTANPKP